MTTERVDRETAVRDDYARMFISMSTDYLMRGITWETYVRNAEIAIGQMAALAAEGKVACDICEWVEELDGGWFHTGCDKDFVLTAGTLAENDMRYCCYCGKPLKETPYKEEVAHGTEA